jgi:hypothetical protein
MANREEIEATKIGFERRGLWQTDRMHGARFW